jgi:predicted RecA/RadA family phage recombinase
MTNYVQDGRHLTAPAPSGGVVSGTAYALGTVVGVAIATAAETVPVAFQICGVVSVPKTGSQAWTVGALVYVTSGGVFTTSAGGNTLAGVAWEAVGSGAGETTGKVLLNGNPG